MIDFWRNQRIIFSANVNRSIFDPSPAPHHPKWPLRQAGTRDGGHSIGYRRHFYFHCSPRQLTRKNPWKKSRKKIINLKNVLKKWSKLSTIQDWKMLERTFSSFWAWRQSWGYRIVIADHFRSDHDHEWS